ncbi:MAG TPA: hypothetical protein IAA29_21250 [Candidatus Paenibacillus intestinavium]|nr:hypothetical protein [Candidatus Paenibacillus intestinavium]
MEWINVSPSTAIKLGVILLYALSIYGLIGVLFTPLLKRWRSNPFLKFDVKGSAPDEKGKRFSSLELLLRATSNPANYTGSSTVQFITLTVSVFVMGYVLLIVGSLGEFPRYWLEWWDMFSFSMALVISAIPYGWRLIKLQLLRTANSYALIEATELMLIQYRTPGQEVNIHHVLSDMVGKLEGPMKRTFYSMVTLLQVEGKTAIYEAVELFEFQIKNTWSRQLGILMIKSALHNRNIERALQKLHEDMVQGKQIVEGEKTEYMESIIMGFFPLILVPSIIFYINHMFDGVVLQLLFTDASVFKSLMVCIVFIIVGLGTSLVLSRPKIEV